jgi:hypothetical protein
MNNQYKINRLLQNIVYQDRKENYIKIYPNNSLRHEEVKFQIAHKCIRNGFKVYSECRFTQNRGRADLVIISPQGIGWIIEVICSESRESIDKKLCKYPLEFEFLEVKTENFNIDSWEL